MLSFPEQMSWLGFVLLACLPGFQPTSGIRRAARPCVAFVPHTVAGRREHFTPLPCHPKTCGRPPARFERRRPKSRYEV